MNSANSYKGYAYGAAAIVAAYLVSLVSWLDTRGVISLMPQSFIGHPLEVWFGIASIVVDIPGWFIVTGVRGDRPATRLTDILITILNGIFWGLIIILITKLAKLLMRHIRPTVR